MSDIEIMLAEIQEELEWSEAEISEMQWEKTEWSNYSEE